MKRILNLSLAFVCCFFLLTMPSFAATPDEADPQYMPATYIWEIQSEEVVRIEDRGQKRLIGSDTATAEGEVISVEATGDGPITVTGTVKVGYKLIETSIELMFSDPDQYVARKSTPPLKKGTVVISYAQPQAAYVKFVQVERKFDQVGNSELTGNTAICYVWKPIKPRIIFEYR